MKALKTTLLLAFILLLAEVRTQTNETEEEDNAVYTFVEVPPSFPGGVDSLKLYLEINAKYPEIYRRYQYKEMLIVNFVIEKDGSISNIKLLQGGFKEFEKTAIELVENMPRWNPAMQNGKPMRYYMTLPINFCPDGCTQW